ncbi:MAG: cysteine desulfurase [Micavibrio sp.]|nr:MAG: cysteine desulfurase [Micavibrio sp.]
MNSFEFNKIFAAVLVAGITAMFAGFVAENVIHAHALEKDAVEIEGVESSGGGVAVEKLAEPVLHLVASADVEKGKKLSKACASCHSFEKGGPVKTGPTLWGVVGSSKGGTSGFGYSSGMMEMGGKWSYADLNKFLWKPKKFVSGTKMNFIGLKKPEDRAAMIAWLRTLSDSPKALPGDSEIAAEQADLVLPEVLAEKVEDAVEMIEEIAEEAADVTPHAGDEVQEPIAATPTKKPVIEEAP